MPKTGDVRPAAEKDLVKHGPYKTPRAYAKAVKEYGGEMPKQSPFVD
jgi:hypothetical protein